MSTTTSDKPYLKQLYDRYILERQGDSLTLEEFEQVFLLFPAILVAQADGHVDTSEMIQLNKMLRHLLARTKQLKEYDLKGEIRYITWNTRVWRDPFLRALREYIEEFRVEEMIVDLMIAAASSSTGNLINNILLQTLNPGSSGPNAAPATFISDEERAEIFKVIDFLGLSENTRILAKLAQI